MLLLSLYLCSLNFIAGVKNVKTLPTYRDNSFIR
ncbi:MAG: hypothetical protein K1X91_07540 [Bacteriodetes bacterium]|nr:hypothetical protein [Bacteroidota bacterium]